MSAGASSLDGGADSPDLAAALEAAAGWAADAANCSHPVSPRCRRLSGTARRGCSDVGAGQSAGALPKLADMCWGSALSFPPGHQPQCPHSLGHPRHPAVVACC